MLHVEIDRSNNPRHRHANDDYEDNQLYQRYASLPGSFRKISRLFLHEHILSRVRGKLP